MSLNPNIAIYSFFFFLGEASDEAGVSGSDGDAEMVDGDLRQGADLKNQIGLFVDMSTPFFKVVYRQYILVGRVVDWDHIRYQTRRAILVSPRQ